MLNRTTERGYPCLVPDTWGKHSVGIRYNDRFCRCMLLGWGRSLLFLVYWKFLSLMDAVFCQMYFCMSVDRIMCFFFFSPLIFEYWAILAFPRYGKNVLFFFYIVGYKLLVFHWVFLYVFSWGILDCSFYVCVFSLFDFDIRVMQDS